MYALLKSKSEQERRLLTALVNKVSVINICNFYKPKFISLGLYNCEFRKFIDTVSHSSSCVMAYSWEIQITKLRQMLTFT